MVPYFLIARTSSSQGPVYVLWTRDHMGVWVLPWASPDRRDMQALGRSLAELGARSDEPSLSASLIVAGTLRHAAGRRIRLILLDDEERTRIGRAISSGPNGACSMRAPRARRALDPELLARMGERLAALG